MRKLTYAEPDKSTQLKNVHSSCLDTKMPAWLLALLISDYLERWAIQTMRNSIFAKSGYLHLVSTYVRSLVTADTSETHPSLRATRLLGSKPPPLFANLLGAASGEPQHVTHKWSTQLHNSSYLARSISRTPKEWPSRVPTTLGHLWLSSHASQSDNRFWTGINETTLFQILILIYITSFAYMTRKSNSNCKCAHSMF